MNPPNSFASKWFDARDARHYILDQTCLPFARVSVELGSLHDVATAIREMQVRGAPLIGLTAALGVALAMREDPSDTALNAAIATLQSTRPTAVNLAWALARMRSLLEGIPPAERAHVAMAAHDEMSNRDVAMNYAIGSHGLLLLRSLHARLSRPINVLTHCNAGALAAVGYGTALAPLILAQRESLPIHVYVDETRPRNQGLLTALELREYGIDHTYIVDNAGGHLMQRGMIDWVIVGADRITTRGDVANKIGTYLKALAANDCGVPFYVAAPVSTIDPTAQDGLREIEIEERHASEVRSVCGVSAENGSSSSRINLLDDSTKVANPAFDVTPARLVTGIITEHGVFAPAKIVDALRVARPA